MKSLPARIGYVLLLALPPLLAALYAGATTIPGGSLYPWAPAMIDLDVYRRTGELVLQGQDFYNVEAWLPWIDPPFPALLAVPFGARDQLAPTIREYAETLHITTSTASTAARSGAESGGESARAASATSG